ncbi:DUF3006 domain-containing protein [Oceanobacillus massiliensis]|uniref:DUF3006 domain-containing protein n=1 Tax=Oceanobacillus massiliensis TaxID=1465765 RepID=UPI0002891C16|nr:DUF3006 domain-containing protein [Oceanobacillus massiliensis]
MEGILDRFEGETAVILIDKNKTELIIDKSKLPAGSKIGTVFHVEKEGGEFKPVSINVEKTQMEAEKSSDLMEKLRSKSKGSKFLKK